KNLGLLVGATLIVLVWRWVRDSGPIMFSAYSQTPVAAILYARMLQRLKKRGVRKKPQWTHREFLQNLSTLSQDQRAIVERITHFYEKSRFGALLLADAQIRKMRQLIRQL
ncbi:MAG: DUF4129 domain-containing protein, partial [Nitrospinales bacterium]